MARKEIQRLHPTLYNQETSPPIEKFLMETSPIVWEVAIFAQKADFVLNDTTFNEAIHERFSGSDAKSDKIKAVVWPRLAERFTGKTLCKGKVLTGL